MTVYGVVLFALAAALAVTVVKEAKPELALPLSVASGVVVIMLCLRCAAPIVTQLKNAVEPMNIKSEYITVLLKSLGICYITQFAADTCCDFGQNALGNKVELFGRLTIAALNLPLVISLITTVSGLID